MGLIQASRQSAGGGGGGITITGFEVEVITQVTDFAAGLTLTLAQVPVSPQAITIDYNGQRLNYGTEWQYNVGLNEIEILFADPYVTTYDTPPTFQIYYPY